MRAPTGGQKYAMGIWEKNNKKKNVLRRLQNSQDICYSSITMIMDTLVANLTALRLTGAAQLLLCCSN